MYFVRKKDLKIVGGVSTHVVQFQMQDYCSDKSIMLKKETVENNSKK